MTALAMLVITTPCVNAEESKSAVGSPVALKWNAGFDFSQGDYGLRGAGQGLKNTTLYYVPIGVTVDYQRFRAKLIIPFLVSNGPTEVDPSGARLRDLKWRRASDKSKPAEVFCSIRLARACPSLRPRSK